ncbi:MAG: TauD/TfdA dioxygenase family protein [Pseudomonadales bacterium]|jgi:taurine dioxygenase
MTTDSGHTLTTRTDWRALPWSRLDGPVGLELAGIDVRQIAPEMVHAAIAQAQLLVFRDQRLDPLALTEFAARLGTPEKYPYANPLPDARYVVPIIKEPEDRANFGGDWHTDTSYLERPPAFTLLLAVETPPTGGDTLFADMYDAYAALSPKLREWLDTLAARNVSGMVHDSGGAHAAVAGAPRGTRSAKAAAAVHPVVRVHPITGRPALYLSRIHSEHFIGWTREESVPLIDFLQNFAVRAERCSRLRWAPGTLAIWDNRCLQHYPLNDYHGHRREMHRIILAGERPRGVFETPQDA